MKAFRSIMTALAIAGILSASASAGILFEDIAYWMPDGSTLINPSTGPTDALIKVQETVYDDATGRTVLAAALAAGVTTGPAIPAGPINLYAYTITNLTYGHNATGGITGYDVSALPIIGGPGVMYSPTGAVDLWEGPAYGPTGSHYEWAIDMDGDTVNGDGTGILLGLSFNSFYLVVPDGTPHGFVPASAYTFSAGEGSAEAHRVHGIVSAPIPAPGAALLGVLGLGMVGWAKRKFRS